MTAELENCWQMEIQHGTSISIIQPKTLTEPYQLPIIIQRSLERESILMAAMCLISQMDKSKAILTNPIGTGFIST